MERRLGNVGKAERLFRRGEEATRDAARGIVGAASGTRVRRVREADAAAKRDLGGARRAKELEVDASASLASSGKEVFTHGSGDGSGDVRTSRRSRLGGGGGSRAKLRARSSLLCSWASFEVARGSPTSGRRGDGYMPLARTLFREAVDTCPENAQAWTQWWKAEAIASRGGSGVGLGGLGFRLNPPNAGAGQLAVANEGLAGAPGTSDFGTRGRCAQIAHGHGRREARARSPGSRLPRERTRRHSLGLLQELGEFDAAVKAFESGKDASLPCLTAAAAAASHSGDVARARGLFMEGSAVASSGGGRGRTGGFGPGGGLNDGGSSSTSFDSFDSHAFGGAFDGSFVDAAAVDGAGAAYASPGSSSSSRGGGVSSSSSAQLSSSAAAYGEG